MPLNTNTYKRRSGIRDARLIVIACEGQRTEPDYFEELTSRNYHCSPNVHVEILRRQSSASSPKSVLSELHKFKSEYGLNNTDTLWMIIDRDKWTDNELNIVAAECDEFGYSMALSNPCFELWLLLHFKDVSAFTKKDIVNICSCKASIKNKLIEYIESFDVAANVDLAILLPRVRRAISNARKLDTNPQDRWPIEIGTRVYIVVEDIINP